MIHSSSDLYVTTLHCEMTRATHNAEHDLYTQKALFSKHHTLCTILFKVNFTFGIENKFKSTEKGLDQLRDKPMRWFAHGQGDSLLGMKEDHWLDVRWISVYLYCIA